MIRYWRRVCAILIAVPLLTGCFEDSKAEILAKAENASDKAALTEALGKPDNIDRVGPLETWAYNASNGSVDFVIAGSTVTLRKTGGKAE